MENQVTLIRDNIYMIKTPLTGSPLRWINNFLIKGEDRCLLIDTAFNREECFLSIKNGIEKVGGTLDNTDIFLTHMHADHAGLVGKLKHDKNKIYAGKKDGDTVNDLNNLRHWKMIKNTSVAAGIPDEFEVPYYEHVAYKNRPDHNVDFTFVNEGDKFSFGGHSFVVLDLKGHTPGHIGLYDEEEGILFSGDHILNNITPHITCWDLENDYLGVYMENLKKVRKLKLNLVLSAHRELCEDPYERIDFLLKHHEKRLSEALYALSDGREKTAYDCAFYMTWSFRKTFGEFPDLQKWFASSEALAHLQHLYFEGKVKREIREGRAYFYL